MYITVALISMKPFIRELYYSFPVQLFILHFKKFQVLLLFWYILFSTVNGSFMKTYGAGSLFLAPEYLGEVNALAAAMVGVAVGIFFMSWNITTFILLSRYFRFLATASNPFLKYCINNFILPLAFLVFYMIRAIDFGLHRELLSASSIFLQIIGFISGLVLLLMASFYYFFRYDKRISGQVAPVITDPKQFKTQFKKEHTRLNENRVIKVHYYLQTPFSIKKVRDVSHYSRDFIESVFGRHHFAAVLSIFVAFIFLIILGFLLDNPVFQFPASASITLLFAILIAVFGAFSYFLQSWSVPFLLGLIVLLNLLYRYEVIDPTNKAYGLKYPAKAERPVYDPSGLSALCTDSLMELDKQNMLQVLEAWKKNQTDSKPVMFLINTSGGGNRSAAFTLNMLQELDSVSNGTLMRRTFMITGASGGMLGASYFRQLDRERLSNPSLRLQDPQYESNISGDLLNPLFSSLIARDLASPAQKFKVGDYTYIKDRGYAFEEKLNRNTRGLLNYRLKELVEEERTARIPLLIFHSVITRDGRKLIIGTQPMRFLMRPAMGKPYLSDTDPDAVDYQSFFSKQDPLNLRLLTALRMNATFPYVLPNVWLPTQPVVDVMDAGLWDYFGQESTLRFVQVFKDWLKENTSAVVLLQLRDRRAGGWDHPFESDGISELVTKPMLLLQYNWYKMQEYSQNDLLSHTQAALGNQFYKIGFEYALGKEEGRAALNFHLTKMEQQDIAASMKSEYNQQGLQQVAALLKKRDSVTRQ